MKSDQEREVDTGHCEELKPPTLKSAQHGVIIWWMIEDYPSKRKDAFR